MLNTSLPLCPCASYAVNLSATAVLARCVGRLPELCIASQYLTVHPMQEKEKMNGSLSNCASAYTVDRSMQQLNKL